MNETIIAGLYIIGGMLVCTAGGLLSLRPDPEKSKAFVPVYILSMSIFLFGLAMVVWQQDLWKEIGELFS